MTLEALQAAAQVQGVGTTTVEGMLPLRGASVQGPGFGEMVAAGLGAVNGQLMASQADMQGLAVGDVQNLHQVMIRLEESRLSFELMLHVRNRILEAYQDLMKMQV
jgi:flagellar hook-basal body complex protein FliE